jgi:hypothetical protein
MNHRIEKLIRGACLLLYIVSYSRFRTVAESYGGGRGVLTSPEISNIRSFSQNWTDSQAKQFYNIAQGSRMVPYEWFLHLEQANSTNLFRDNDHIRSLGYLPRSSEAVLNLMACRWASFAMKDFSD